MKSLVLANAWSANKKYQWTVFSREYLWILQKFMSLLTFKYMCVCRDDQNSMTSLSCKLLQTPDVLFHFTKSSECNKRFEHLVVIHQFLRHPESSFISDSYFPASVSSRVATDREPRFRSSQEIGLQSHGNLDLKWLKTWEFRRKMPNMDGSQSKVRVRLKGSHLTRKVE